MSDSYKAYRDRQISICVQNERGILAAMTTLLGQHHINILAMTLTGGQDHGYMRIVVDQTDAAVDILVQNEYLAFVSDVVLLEIDNTPGALGAVAEEWCRLGVNIDYVYCAGGPGVSRGLVVIHVDNIDLALN